MDRENTDNSASARKQIQNHICSLKIDKATKFLSLPDIKKVNNDAVKVQFLKSKGLNGREINEAFRLFKLPKNKSSVVQSFAPKIALNEVANVKSNRTNALMPHRRSDIDESSVFASFCKKLIVIAGITSTCYYLYQKWLRWQDDRKKEEHSIREELNQIKNDLRKILMDLRQQELVKQNQNDLITEINSIKAILVGRHNFEEKPSKKTTPPSWQLVGTKEKLPENRHKITAESSSTISATESQSAKEPKNEISKAVSVSSENDSCKIPPAVSDNCEITSRETTEKKSENLSGNKAALSEKSLETKKIEKKN